MTFTLNHHSMFPSFTPQAGSRPNLPASRGPVVALIRTSTGDYGSTTGRCGLEPATRPRSSLPGPTIGLLRQFGRVRAAVMPGISPGAVAATARCGAGSERTSPPSHDRLAGLPTNHTAMVSISKHGKNGVPAMPNGSARELVIMEAVEELETELLRKLATWANPPPEAFAYARQVRGVVTLTSQYCQEREILRTLDRRGLHSVRARRELTHLWKERARGQVIAFPGKEMTEPEDAA